MRIGKGGDKDELNTVYIYDSHIFPFHRAEQYHQFYKVPPCPLHVSLALARCSVSCSVSSSPFFFLSSCWLAVTHAAGARGCQSGAREPRTHRTHWLPGAGTPLFSLGLNHQLLSTRLSVAIAAKQGQEWQHGTNEERLLTFLHRDSGLCAPRLPTVLYPRSTGSNGTLLFEEQSASSTEKQRRVNSC